MKQLPDIEELMQMSIDAFNAQNPSKFHIILDQVKEIIEDISTYQIELTAQNEELSIIKKNLNITNEKYKALYDSSPAAIFTLDKDGLILSANLTSANLIGIQIKDLVGRYITSLIASESQDEFYIYLNDVLNSSLCLQCKVVIKTKSGDRTLSGYSRLVKGDLQDEIHSSFIDITEIEKNRSLLEEQQHLFHDLFEYSGDANYLLDNDIYIDCNAKALEVFGLDSKSQIIGAHPYDFSTDNQPDGMNSIEKAKMLINTANKDGSVQFEWVHINKKTGIIYTDVTLTTIKKEGRHLILATLRNISEKKKNELELKKSEAHLKATIENSNYAIALFSIDGTLEKHNKQFERGLKLLFSLDTNSHITINSIIAQVEDKDYWYANMNKLLSGERVFFEKEFKLKGELRYFDFAINPVYINDNLIGFSLYSSDISKYIKAERLLQATNEELEAMVSQRTSELAEQLNFQSTLLDTIPDLIFVKDINSRYINCNLAYCSYLGIGKDEILGKNDWDLYFKEEAEIFYSTDKILFDSLRSIRSEQTLTFPDGSIVIYDTLKTPYYSPTGELLGLIGICRDINDIKKLEDDIKKINSELEVLVEKRTQKLREEIQERVRAEDALKKSREMYRNLFNDIPIGIYRTTVEGNILLANPALVSMLGFNTLNLLKLRNLNMEGFVDPHYRKSFLNEVLNSDDVKVFDTIWIKSDGTELHVLEKAKAIRNFDNSILYIEGTAEDITERIKSEKLRQTVYRISESAYRIHILDDLYKFIHKSIGQLINCENFFIAIYDNKKNEIVFPYFVDEVDSPEPSKLGPYPFGNGLTEYIINQGTFKLLTKVEIVELQEQGIISEGGTIPDTWLGVPLMTTDSKIIGVIAVQSYNPIIKYDSSAKDILVFVSTQVAMVINRKQIEEALYNERRYLAERVLERTEELSALNAELERAVRTKDEFLANMSHELRTPLNAILGLSEILLKNKDISENEKQRKALSTIRESGSHLLNLINDILDLSKIEAGKMEINFEELSVESVANTCINFIKQSSFKKSIELELNIEEKCPRIFFADNVRIKQILINLLNNAVKFTENGGKVGLKVFCDKSNDSINYLVWDTGIGISAENMLKLFKPFSQISSNLARDYEGTGLGLSLVSKLTEMHGGGVAIESEVGIGSKFTVSLPLKNPMLSAEKISESVAKKVINLSTALIIEDSADDAIILTDYLQRISINSELYQFDMHLDEVLSHKKYDIVFLDILLWDRSGWEILTQIKKNSNSENIPVIVTTVLKERARANAYGADGYLNKPYSFNTFYDIVHKIDLKYEMIYNSNIDSKGLIMEKENQTLILLAEDNEANLQTLETFLEYAGFTIVSARNGREAIDAAIEYKPDLILMDIQMPKVDGLEAIRQIKLSSEVANVPIIALTALAMPGDKERCIAAGANEYVSKPVNFETLITSINRLLPEDKQKNEGF